MAVHEMGPYRQYRAVWITWAPDTMAAMVVNNNDHALCVSCVSKCYYDVPHSCTLI